MAVLLGLLLGALGKARETANAVACLSNLRQLGLACSLYSESNSEFLPYPNRNFSGSSSTLDRQMCWVNALDPFLLGANAATNNASEKIAWIKQDPIIKKLGSEWLADAHTIKMNRRLGENTDGSPKFYQLADFQNPSLTVLLFDGRAETEKLSSGSPSVNAKNPEGVEGLVSRRHSDRANVLFVDGHVETRSEKKQSTGTRLGWELDQTRLIWKPWQISTVE